MTAPPADLAALDAAEPDLFPSPGDPMAVARHLIAGRTSGEVYTLRSWRHGWQSWRGSHWAETDADEVRAWIYAETEHASYWHQGRGGEAQLKPWEPNRRKVADAADALLAVTLLPEHVQAPAWLTPGEHVPAGRLVACANGLLDVTTRQLHPHTPEFFNHVAVPFDYAAGAAEPVRWLGFLAQLWPDDPEAIGALQEWFGYVLSGRTDLQKIFLLTGPTRSGKGTIARVLAGLVGHGNTAGPTLASLATNFGLSPLLGKPLALVSDARLGGADARAVVERLLSISGEDMITVDRKYKPPWTGKLGARFMILSNELPRFGDASGAIANRFVILTMERSWLGRENAGLTPALLAELPGILNWSLAGLERLTERGYLAEPPSSAEAAVTLADLVSPVAAFIRSECETGPVCEVAAKAIFEAWRSWCDDNGHRAGSAQSFGRDLRAVLPALRLTKPRGEEPPARARLLGAAA